MMRNAARLLGAGLALASMLTAAWAPVRPQTEDLTVRVTQVDRSRFPQVTVYISATDAAGAPVPFSADEVRIEEDGVAVELSAVEGVSAVGPLSTLLVMDVSGSMDVAGKLGAAKAAARAYVDQMRPGDQAGLVAFDVEVDYVQPLTGDRQSLMQAIDGLTARRDTAMYDALIRATEILRPASGRKAVLVLTDGMDNSSRATLDEVLAEIGPAGLSISTIGLGNVDGRHGFAEELPVVSESIDVVISNGVINLCPDKLAVMREVHRVLKPGGRFQIADILVHKEVPQESKDDIDLWSG